MFPACRTHTVPYEAGPHPLVTALQLRVMEGSKQIGRALLKEIQAPDQPVHFYRFELLSGAVVGFADMDGRFFKHRLFAEEGEAATDIGLHSFSAGVQRLFERSGPLRVLPLKDKGQPTEAAARKMVREAIGQPPRKD